MGNDSFSLRRNELEEKFFREKDQELIRAMREKTAKLERKKALAEASGIEHEDLLHQLDELNVSAETLAALSLVPLVAVAWADGNCDDQERAAILKSADQVGLHEGHAGYELLQSWLEQKPEKQLYSTWRDYVGALCDMLTPQAKTELCEDVLGRAKAVAEASGGFLGFGSKISKVEQDVLDDLARAFK